jgi:hypothetical protein
LQCVQSKVSRVRVRLIWTLELSEGSKASHARVSATVCSGCDGVNTNGGPCIASIALHARMASPLPSKPTPEPHPLQHTRVKCPHMHSQQPVKPSVMQITSSVLQSSVHTTYMQVSWAVGCWCALATHTHPPGHQHGLALHAQCTPHSNMLKSNPYAHSA